MGDASVNHLEHLVGRPLTVEEYTLGDIDELKHNHILALPVKLLKLNLEVQIALVLKKEDLVVEFFLLVHLANVVDTVLLL